MQEKNDRPPVPNAQRSAQTRAQLLSAARDLFVAKGYAETGTPEIVRAASVTRGALYHHFTDKADLFRAVVEAEAKAIAQEIGETALAADPGATITAGARAYFDAMGKPGRVRLLLLDGPAVLGPDELARIDREAGGGELRAGLAALAPGIPGDMLDALAAVLSAGFDRAALDISGGAPQNAYISALEHVLSRLTEAG